jgi:hypothetical protein
MTKQESYQKRDIITSEMLKWTTQILFLILFLLMIGSILYIKFLK